MDAKYILWLTFLVVQVSCEQKKSLTFVIDATRSMADEIAHVRQAAKSIMDIVLKEKSTQIEDIVLVVFRDPGWEFRKRTRDEAELKKALDDITLIGNMDCPEMCLSGIKMGLDESLPGSFLYVFTDASAKDYEKFEEIKHLSQGKQIQVVFVLTGDCGAFAAGTSLEVYYKISAATSGQVLTVSKENVGEVLEYVTETIKGDSTVITSTMVHPTVGSDSYVSFNIDEKVEYALVSTSGSDVTLKVSKDGIELPGKKVTWTKNFKVLKLVGITPGLHQAAVRGSSDVNVMVFGRTDFNFAFGFSDNEQNSLKYTETQPNIGSETHLIISVKDDEHSVNIENLEILDMEEMVIRRLNLTNVGSNVYRTDKFLPPDVIFKVAVNATARSTGNPIRRISNTPVEPIKPVIVAPEITDTEKYMEAMEDSKVNIHCRIRQGKPKPHVTWYFKQRGADEFNLLPSKTDDDLFISNVLTGDIGEYQCVAENNAGQAKHTVQLEVFVKPKFEDAPATIKEEENVSVTLKCKLRKGNPRPTITWSFQASGSATFTALSNSGEELILPAVQLKDSGQYRCVAENSAGRDERTTLVTILVAPEIERSTPSIIKVKENATISVPCRLSKGFPTPTISWLYKDADSTEYAAIPDSNADVLHLEHIQLFKAGHYKCVAQNTAGQTEKDVQVIVEAPPRIVFIPPNSPFYEGVEGDVMMRLPCTAVGFPKPSVSWIVDEVVVGKDKSRSLYVEDDVFYLKNPLRFSSSNNSTHTFHTYVCHAVNDFGADEKTYEVTVSVAPEIERSTPSIIRVKENAAISVPCRLSKGFPKPTISWWYKDAKSTEYTAISDSNAELLHLEHIHLSKAGHYKCIARNTVGQSEKDVQVIVEVKPKFEDAPATIKEKENKPVTLKCKLRKGNPRPKITWSFQASGSATFTTLRNSGEELRLKAVQLKDSGQYRCVAENSAGRDERTTLVTILALVIVETDRKYEITLIRRLHLIVVPEIKRSTPSIIRVKENSAISVPCRLHKGNPRPKITWSFQATGSATLTTLSNSGEELRLPAVKLKDSGEYRCVAENSAGHDEKTTLVTILAAPEIERSTPSIIIVKENAAISVPCRLSKGFPKPTISWWYKDATSTEYAAIPHSNADVLHLEHIQLSKAGHYKCVAQNTVGRTEKDVQILVEVVPEIERSTPSIIRVKENSATFLPCRLSKGFPKPTISWWYKNANSTEYAAIPGSNADVLHLEHIKLFKAGHYKCVAQNTVGQTEKDVQVIVEALIPETAPIVTIDGADEMDAEYDEPLQLKCKVSGYPKPDIIWNSDDPTVKTTQTDSTTRLPSNFVSALEINKVNKNATYTCKATNKLGIGTKSVVVKTKKKTYFNILELPKDITIEYAKEGQIHCKVDAFPPASITWFKNYKRLITDGNIELSTDNSILYIRSMAPYIADKYACDARNSLKRSWTIFEIYIGGVEPPEINKTTNYITAMKDSNVDMHCDVIKGKPKPTVTWLYNDQYSSTFTDLQVTSDTISFDNLSSDDKAIYRCIAENVVGNDYHDIELSVEYKPEVTKSTSPRIVKNEGETVTLLCPVDGSPTPDVVWKLNGRKIMGVTHKIFRDGSIRFKATLSSSGNYECEASNHHGVVRINTKVDVIIPVKIEPPIRGTYEVMVGTNAMIPCRADGFPQPVLSWVYYSKDPKIASKAFTPSDRTGSLVLPRIQQGQDGYYTCVAKNAGGSKNITYEVIVLASPFIMFTTKQFRAVLDDMMLRVPCHASGNPKPTITWMKNGYDVPTGSVWYDMTEDGSLIIKNVDIESAGSYVCLARNKFGVDKQAFDVIVESHAMARFITNTYTVEEGKPAAVPCSVPHQRTDRIRWFKDNRLVANGELQLPYVSSRDSGVYTCRVSSFTGAKTGGTIVITGSKPQFIHYTEKENVIEYNVGGLQVMDCSTRGVTKPEVKWLHDGASMDYDQLTYTLQMYSPSVKGRYTCIVTNEFGSAHQEFVVQTLGCGLDIKNDFNGNAPLMLTPKLELPKFEVADGHVIIPRDEFIVLFCPMGFTILYKRQIEVTCKKNKEFDYEGTKLLYSDLKCKTKLEPIPDVKTKHRCNHGNSGLIDIGFNTGKKFVAVYQVCMDRSKTVYSKLNIQPTLANVLPSYGFNNRAYSDLNTIFNCNYQNKKITEVLGLEFHRSDGCCFEKRQLVSPKDVAPGLSQTATYTLVNVVPHWSSCNSQNWDDVEQRIRMLAVRANHELQVWTGVAQDLQLPDTHSNLRNITFQMRRIQQQVPKYLWKVVQDPASKASLAIIQVNVPDLKQQESWKYRLCNDVCGDVKWMQSSHWRDVHRGFTYCCNLSEFGRAFRYSGEFPSYTKLLKDVDLVADYHV